jgi:hypothetical protein
MIKLNDFLFQKYTVYRNGRKIAHVVGKSGTVGKGFLQA